MNTKSIIDSNITEQNKALLVQWEEKYATKIAVIDRQHKELIRITNQLYKTCLDGEEAAGPAFKAVLGHMVSYVCVHFNIEIKLMKQAQYPGAGEHKVQHDQMIKKILQAANDFKMGRKLVPINFVKTLREWILGHIAFYDKNYAIYIANKRSGITPGV